ncbi:hypothetical protein, variant [Blastomyces dermatitidis ER-3]|uniref:Uncharacterized protein n=1 Tax=Ajellomyces dermatitidis (strain ER-3 / ATCC MYA-2586) TaxID=559297 RepID=A0ABX2VZ18_AJEDR|nr:uncharacterized protein BDCG_07336 [Blastomyces dermatitidis ER-3]XP_045282083.1 hypothetical protein, variant [Blastomyces dermatitidis ER-3]OAT02355.1 hypothetical protein BDCG_07336 [Blastomyces dermatitidis ER-3]OAT02356.1 hypothetical protein, variant [Blastomyces dermatitidis ER-3]
MGKSHMTWGFPVLPQLTTRMLCLFSRQLACYGIIDDDTVRDSYPQPSNVRKGVLYLLTSVDRGCTVWNLDTPLLVHFCLKSMARGAGRPAEFPDPDTKALLGNAKIAGMNKDLQLHGMQYNVALTIFFVPFSL